ncbi:hypothetical protein AVEN_181213-1 [Araneus ventricosus]|uniref:Uncharacterized protein n=1 Tax=Araneus ventricosus TaxID=182803 RepID=A0A4Y2KX84_ARAVE|nr:hypothetical protein AVEN_181213-1 [Araneus ventricosus]
MKAREIAQDGNYVRRFIIPVVNFRATDYVDLIDWQACNVTPPTALRHISCHELPKMIQDDVPMDGWDFIKFHSHTQAVERIVKLVTEASRKKVGPQNRDGFIRVTLESIKQMSQFESKKDLKNCAFAILYVSKVESSFYSHYNVINHNNHNTLTVDGHGTFDVMEGVQCVHFLSSAHNNSCR